MDSSIASRPVVRATTDYTALAIPVLLWVLAILVAHPWGNFPLDDDWSFAIAVQRLLDTGTFRPYGWTSMTLVGQTYWGGLFALLFGFSYNVLRISTIVSGALGLGAFALMLRELGCDRRKTIIATLAVGFNPIYVTLAGTFMTDVGFAALCMFTALFFCRYLRERRATSYVWAIVFSIAALSVRQLSIFLPVAMLLTLLIDNRRDWRAISVAALTVLASFALLKGYVAWLAARNAIPSEFFSPSQGLSRLLSEPMVLLVKIEQGTRAAIEQIGWYVFPLLMLRVPGLIRGWLARPWGRQIMASVLLASVAWCVLMIGTHHMMPLNWTTVHVSGTGPVWMHDSRDYALDVAPLPAPFWMFITFLATTGGELLLLDIALTALTLFSAWRARQITSALSVRMFLMTAGVIYLAPLIGAGFYDRYLMPAIVLFIALIAFETQVLPAEPRSSSQFSRTRLLRIAAIATLVITGAFGVAGLHDYLSWNRARWMLLDTLINRGVPVTQIDGGYEFNGLYMYVPHYDYLAPHAKSWWVHDDRYIVQFKPQPGYRVIDSADTEGWLSPFKTRILTLERIADGAAASPQAAPQSAQQFAQ